MGMECGSLYPDEYSGVGGRRQARSGCLASGTGRARAAGAAGEARRRPGGPVIMPKGPTQQGDLAMTEQEWLSEDDPSPMLEFVASRAGDRKLRLFLCACCARV